AGRPSRHAEQSVGKWPEGMNHIIAATFREAYRRDRAGEKIAGKEGEKVGAFSKPVGGRLVVRQRLDCRRRVAEAVHTSAVDHLVPEPPIARGEHLHLDAARPETLDRFRQPGSYYVRR